MTRREINRNLIAKAQIDADARDLAHLQTAEGGHDHLVEYDGVILKDLVDQLALLSGKPVFANRIFGINVTNIMAIAQAVQYMPMDLRMALPTTHGAIIERTKTAIAREGISLERRNELEEDLVGYLSADKPLESVFTEQIRDTLITNYGRLPYFAPEQFLDIDGEKVSIDPTRTATASAGIRPNAKAVNSAVISIASRLGLLAEYTCTESQVELAWKNAEVKTANASKHDGYHGNM